MNSKFIIKFEKGNLEQTYKLAEIDLLNGLNGVFELLDEEFISTVVSRFERMNDDFSNTWHRYET
ncbi:hypothetical protein [Arcticibacter eurypsychrophilus]|uniref:hypothetical protein n=1 Tax=Arcticibacter eurypsychrophilus TaxID=1434752 RepID=UPI0009F27EC2|nr:hypothetical protein [Arcticibacter eurypsychrophilus]